MACFQPLWLRLNDVQHFLVNKYGGDSQPEMLKAKAIQKLILQHLLEKKHFKVKPH